MSPALEPLQGKYEIVAKIKEGGMGAIYKVRHRLLEEIRVVKVLRRQLEDDAELNQRFIHEARAAIRLRHPNVVQIFDFLLEGGVGYIVMEYIDGVDLGDLIRRRRRPSLPLFLEVARQGLRALGYLHHKGFVHRDVSPDNLMLACDFAGHPLVKMIDLGIAKKVEGGVSLTASGMFLGKFRYCSPEHFGSQGSGGIEPRSDLYSFAVVLYELLTGRYPIRGEGNSQLIAGHLFHPPLDFDEADPGGRVPKALRDILWKTLDKDPGRRFSSAAELAGALEELQAHFPLTDAVLEEAGAITVREEEEEEPADRGSTQDRLDRGFVHPTPASPGATPASPGAVPLLAEPEPPVTGPSPEEKLFEHHLEAACTLAEEGNYAEALPHFEAALEIQPDNATVAWMRAEARQKLEEERQAVAARLASEVRQLRELAAAGDLEQTRARLVSARRAYGDAEALSEVQAEIEQVEAQGQCREIAEALEEAEELRQAGDFTLVAQSLERVRAALKSTVVRGTEQGPDLLARLDRQEAALEKALRHAAELDEAAYEVESFIGQGKLVEADRALFQALEAFGPAPRLAELRQRLDEIHHQGHQEQLESLVKRAVALMETGEFNEARRSLDKAAILAAANPEIQAELAAHESALRRAQEARREGELRKVESLLEELIERGNLEQAQAELAAAEARLGLDEEHFATLRQRIAAGFQERIGALVREAGVAFEAKRYRNAIRFLDQALELAPGDEWITARLAEAHAALAEPGDAATAVDAIVGLIESESLDEAGQRLREAVERWGASPDFDGLELQIEAGRLAERSAESHALAAEAEAAYRQGDLKKARELVSEALRLSPMNADARALVKVLQREIPMEP